MGLPLHKRPCRSLRRSKNRLRSFKVKGLTIGRPWDKAELQPENIKCLDAMTIITFSQNLMN